MPAMVVLALFLIAIGAVAFVLTRPVPKPEEVAKVEPKKVVQPARVQPPAIPPQTKPQVVQPVPPPTPIVPKLEPKPEPKVEPKPEPEVQPKPEPKVEPKAEPKVETTPAPTPEPKKLAVPDDAAQNKALTAIRDIYKQDYEPARKAALAKTMLQKAKDTQDATDRFTLLQEAKKLAAETFQGDLAFEAVDAMVSEYAISGSGMKAEILEKAVNRLRLTPEQKMAIANAALQVIDEAIAENNFNAAKALGKQATN